MDAAPARVPPFTVVAREPGPSAGDAPRAGASCPGRGQAYTGCPYARALRRFAVSTETTVPPAHVQSRRRARIVVRTPERSRPMSAIPDAARIVRTVRGMAASDGGTGSCWASAVPASRTMQRKKLKLRNRERMVQCSVRGSDEL